jgi:hypothetical protein
MTPSTLRRLLAIGALICVVVSLATGPLTLVSVAVLLIALALVL